MNGMLEEFPHYFHEFFGKVLYLLYCDDGDAMTIMTEKNVKLQNPKIVIKHKFQKS